MFIQTSKSTPSYEYFEPYKWHRLDMLRLFLSIIMQDMPWGNLIFHELHSRKSVIEKFYSGRKLRAAFFRYSWEQN